MYETKQNFDDLDIYASHLQLKLKNQCVCIHCPAAPR